MKKFLIGTLLIGLAHLGFSQSSNIGLEEVKLSDVTITPINIDYIDEVHEGAISEKVFTMEKKASRYNIKESPFFNNHTKIFEIRFEKTNGSINANYDRNGKIVSAYESYKDISLPAAIRNAVFKGHPGWTIVRNVYQVSYRHNKGAKKIYKLKISKGNLQKKLKIDVDS